MLLFLFKTDYVIWTIYSSKNQKKINIQIIVFKKLWTRFIAFNIDNNKKLFLSTKSAY